MQVSIRHTTVYRYTEPISRATQYLRISPRPSARQRVLAWSIEAPGNATQWTDHHGNICHTVVVSEPLSEFVIVGAGRVETADTSGIVPVTPGDLPPELYLRQTLFTKPDKRLRDFAEARRAAIEADRLDGLHALMVDVSKAVKYQPDATHVHTTAAEAFGDGSGVCQDHAHIFIACCRLLGVPSRYVGGYLATGDDLESHAAGHAWASALVPELGWVSFDPANGVSATERYVRAAIGFDYADAGPIRGVRVGGGDEKLVVEVALHATAMQQ